MFEQTDDHIGEKVAQDDRPHHYQQPYLVRGMRAKKLPDVDGLKGVEHHRRGDKKEDDAQDGENLRSH